MYTRKQALAYARQHRTCPPLDIRNNPLLKKEVGQHIAQCPFCSTGMLNDTDDWDLLAKKIKEDFGHLIKPAKTQKKIIPGQVRSIRGDMACWYKGYYYTPPDVFILDVGTGSENAVTVAQIYHDLTLAGPGDLIVGDRRKFPFEFFIETWNIYTLTTSRIGPVLTELPDKVVKAVKQMDQDPDYLPDWADCLTVFVDEDPRLYFRDIEIEVGYVFSAPAVNELMAEIEEDTPVINLAGIKSAQKDILALIPEASWKIPPATVTEALLTASFPDDRYKMAAAAASDLGVTVQVYQVKATRITDIRSAGAEIILGELEGNIFEVSGQVRDLPSSDGQLDLLCCLIAKKKGGPIFPKTSLWDRNSGHFDIQFVTPAGFVSKNFTLHLALLKMEP